VSERKAYDLVVIGSSTAAPVASSRVRAAGMRADEMGPEDPPVRKFFCDPKIYDHMPGLRYGEDRNHADRCVPIFL
jgi:hypothetical protein